MISVTRVNGIDDTVILPGAFHQHRTGIDTRDGILNQRFISFAARRCAGQIRTSPATTAKTQVPLSPGARRFYRRVHSARMLVWKAIRR